MKKKKRSGAETKTALPRSLDAPSRIRGSIPHFRKRGGCQHLFFSLIWPRPRFPLCPHRSQLRLWVRREGLSANTNMAPPAFTSRESGEVNKQVLVFNCGPLIALPSSVLECSAPPFTVHLPAAPVTSRCNSPTRHRLSLCLSPLGN